MTPWNRAGAWSPCATTEYAVRVRCPTMRGRVTASRAGRRTVACAGTVTTWLSSSTRSSFGALLSRSRDAGCSPVLLRTTVTSRARTAVTSAGSTPSATLLGASTASTASTIVTGPPTPPGTCPWTASANW